jgi:nucleotide-binding universal stress UspA family protein
MNDTTSQTPRTVIVVGTDGSPDADRAIAYAVEEAVRSRRSLRIVHVIPEAVPMTPMLPLFGADSLRAVGSQILAEAAEQVHGLAGEGLVVETVLAHGPRVPALLAHTHDAALVVLGRRASTLARIRTGSTTSAAASRADCPVVAVPEEWVPGAPRHGHVVAAVDGTPASADVVRTALAAAHERGSDLVVVHAWHPLARYDLALGGRGAEEVWMRQTEPVVWSLVAGLRADYPDVEVRVDMRFEHVAEALVEAGREADLLVMGRRGAGAMFGTALGSKARALLRSGVCPVEIVATRRPDPQDVPRQAGRRDVPSRQDAPG